MAWFPGFVVLSLLGGWESRSTDLRLLTGPGLASWDGERALGVSGRVDAPLPLVGHSSLIVSVSTLIVPSWNGDRIYYIARAWG